ncbi:MAG: hypothetical protein FWD98_05295, partial [Defluviitaleaceae bacterium]|nr:hypothetical protein [Defluviitaleaceae bacterium]
MAKTLVAYTDQVDDPDLAMQEIAEQLELETKLLKNSIGIIACHREFVMSGTAQAVCARLPFDVVGAMTSSLSAPGNTGALLMSVMVITADDVEFVSQLTPTLEQDSAAVVYESYKRAARPEPGKPALVLAFAPFMRQNSGDDYVKMLSEASDNAPVFGTIAVDDTEDASNCFTVFNDEYYADRLAMVLVYGNLSPKFYRANVSLDKVLGKSAVVTKSEGHVLMEVNGHHVSVFLEELGLTKASETQYAMLQLPLLLDYNDGSPPVSKAFVSLTPQKHALCAAAIPEGSTLYVARHDKADVLLTTEQAAERIQQD